VIFSTSEPCERKIIQLKKHDINNNTIVRYIADFSPIDRQKNPPIIAPKRGENKIISSKKITLS
jgi:hypothetical protein